MGSYIQSGVGLGYFLVKCRNILGVLLTCNRQLRTNLYTKCVWYKIWNTASPQSYTG